ncbi:glycoside hydrolase family 47 protein [Fistulina hepatica ATCC 64428]|uniref:alpha-1,2-Mannosidase n=1 Tax=Fistulina hepatica ATCC 64428 TaxID=1128425 RepID=A0A0D7A8T4_9AGAR|nr:glycoside hydrolase family 47 protein [Fistulina hepatica ATCC 64428]
MLAIVPVLFAPLLLLPAVQGGSVQASNLTLPDSASTYRSAVIDVFVDSYEAYKEYAWGHDDLEPVTESYVDDYGGWGATIVDALGTTVLMGLDDYFNESLEFIATIDFNVTTTDDTISLFETTIRYVGGLLSAYELSGQQHQILVDKAQEVANKLSYAWIDGYTVPYGYLNFSTNQPTITTTNIAEAGTLTLEWTRLSNFTGNDTYGSLAVGAVEQIIDTTPPLPGLAAQVYNVDSDTFGDAYVTWGGGSDSYFEYLIKYARLSNTDDTIFADTWYTAVDSSITTLLRTSTVGNHTYTADWDDGTILHVGSHLACYAGGNWILGGKLLNNDTIFNMGLALTDACWNTYNSTATGIGPESFAYISSDGDYTGLSAPTTEELEFYDEHGFYITTAYYIQRPEVLESNFYAWRATGDTKYFYRAAAALESFKTYLPTTVGYAGISNVSSTDSEKENETESFWFAEVLKYLFLTFDDPDVISLDEYVFNTEGQPFKAPAEKDVYGSGQLVTYTGVFEPSIDPSADAPVVSPNAVVPSGSD